MEKKEEKKKDMIMEEKRRENVLVCLPEDTAHPRFTINVNYHTTTTTLREIHHDPIQLVVVFLSNSVLVGQTIPDDNIYDPCSFIVVVIVMD